MWRHVISDAGISQDGGNMEEAHPRISKIGFPLKRLVNFGMPDL